MSLPRLVVKRGDDFLVSATLAETAGGVIGAPVSLASTALRAQIRTDTGVLVAELTATVTDATDGIFTLAADRSATAGWPLGVHLADVEFTFPDRRLSTRTCYVVVEADVTHD